MNYGSRQIGSNNGYRNPSSSKAEPYTVPANYHRIREPANELCNVSKLQMEARTQATDRALTIVGLVITAVIIIGILLISWYLSWRRQKDYLNWTLRSKQKITQERLIEEPLTPEQAREAAKKATLAVAAVTTGRRASELMSMVKHQQKIAEAKELLAISEIISKEDACVETTDSLLEFPVIGIKRTNFNGPLIGNSSGNFPLMIETRNSRDKTQHAQAAPNTGVYDSKIHLKDTDPFKTPGNPASLDYAVINSKGKTFLDGKFDLPLARPVIPVIPHHGPPSIESMRYSSMGLRMNEINETGISSQWVAPVKSAVPNRSYDSLGRVSSRQSYSAGNTPLIPVAHRNYPDFMGLNQTNLSNLQHMALAAGYSPNLPHYSHLSNYGIYVNAEDYRTNKPENGPIYSSVQSPEAFTVASQHDALLNELFQRGEKFTNQKVMGLTQIQPMKIDLGNTNSSTVHVNKDLPHSTPVANIQASSQTITLVPGRSNNRQQNPPRTLGISNPYHVNMKNIAPIEEVPLIRSNQSGFHQVQLHNNVGITANTKRGPYQTNTSVPNRFRINSTAMVEPPNNVGRITHLPETLVPNSFRKNR